MLRIGIVGVRGLSLALGFELHPEAEITALCDLDESVLSAQGDKHGIAQRYRVYEDMLAADIDAVVIATPMHCHVPQALQALAAGKHVLCEVTAGISMDELWWLIEAVEARGLTYMMAENYCYIPENQLINAMVQEGLFGEVYYGEGEYLHDVKHLAIPASGVPTWRKYWQLGRHGNVYPTHSLGPVAQWFDGDRIVSVSCVGTGRFTDPRFQQEDTTVTLCQTESGRLIRLRLDGISERPHNLSYYALQGTGGCYEAPRGLGDDHKIWLQGMDETTDSARWRPLKDFADYLPERFRTATEKQRGAGHWGGDFFIVADFVDAVINGCRPPVDVYDACEWTAVGLLSAESLAKRGCPVDVPDFRRRKETQRHG